MPLSTFIPVARKWDTSLETGKRLADLYNVSLTAALVRAVKHGPGLHALVVWRPAWSAAEKEALHSASQLSLCGDNTPQLPPRRLRVRWACSTQDKIFIPPNKSVAFDTSIYRCYESGMPMQAFDRLDLKSICGECYCESMPVALESERHVLSIIHLPQDEHGAGNR